MGTLALLFVGMRAAAEIGVALQMQLGNPSNATADGSNHSHYLIQRSVETIDYNDVLGEANWVSWNLTASDIGSSGRSPSFITDTTLPAGFYRVMTGDYTNSGYNRGHLCPSADRTNTDTNNELVFYMSNIVPQTADNNQGPWATLETYCRTLATSGNELLIIAGGSGYNGTYIASGKAAVPSYTWKIAVVAPSGSGTALTRIGPATRVIAVKIPNVAGVRHDPWTQYLTSANQIQADTGFTFFTALPSSVAAVLRARVDGAPAPSLSNLSAPGGGTGTQVVITGSGFTSASSVSFNGTGAFFVVNSGTQITATVPIGATSGPISVIAPGGLIASTATFTIVAGPTIAGFSPEAGSRNSIAIISGANFGGATEVTFNGAAANFTVDSDGQLTAVVPAGADSGPIRVVTPYGSITSPGNFTITATSGGRPVISQVFGGGGNSGSVYKYDFIEIYNAGTAAVDLSTYAVQYASAAGSSWQQTSLSGTLLPGHYCLVQESQGTGGTQNLPTPQIVGTINMSGTSGKVALTKTQVLLADEAPAGNPAVVDFVGYGGATFYEGVAAAPLLSSTTAAMRTNQGGTDTNDNGADFTALPPTPHNGSAMDAWRSSTFTAAELAAPEISGDLANPSGDGLSNLTKYALNLDPHQPDAASAMSLSVGAVGNERVLTLTHRKNHFAADINCNYEVSFDLSTWSPLAAPVLEVTPLDTQTDQVRVSVSTSAPALFIRVRQSR